MRQIIFFALVFTSVDVFAFDVTITGKLVGYDKNKGTVTIDNSGLKPLKVPKSSVANLDGLIVGKALVVATVDYATLKQMNRELFEKALRK